MPANLRLFLRRVALSVVFLQVRIAWFQAATEQDRFRLASRRKRHLGERDVTLISSTGPVAEDFNRGWYEFIAHAVYE
jgi:hypothetical protein